MLQAVIALCDVDADAADDGNFQVGVVRGPGECCLNVGQGDEHEHSPITCARPRTLPAPLLPDSVVTMWLLDTSTLEHHWFHVPPTAAQPERYAILSHVWNPDGEQTFQVTMAYCIHLYTLWRPLTNTFKQRI